MRSIRFRLTLLYSVIFAVTFLLAGCYVLFAVRDAASDTVDKDLHGRLAALKSYLARQKQHGEQAEFAEELDEQSALGPGRAWLQIADPHGHWLYRSPGITDDSTAPPSAAGLPPRGRTETVIVKGGPLRVLTAAVSENIAQIGTPMDEFEEMFQNLAWGLGLASPILLIIAASSGYWMSGRALKPVDGIAQTLRRITAQNLSQRLALRGTEDELDRLSGVVNQMLSRLESSFHLVTRFTADASHELRTPVGIVRTTAEVIRSRRRPAEEHEAAWDQVVLQAERMSGLIDDLLVLARADAGRAEHNLEPIDLASAVASVAGEMRIIAEQQGLSFHVSTPPECPTLVDPEAIRRLLSALIDNAIKYTPTGGEITISMRNHESFNYPVAIIDVRDTGIGIGPEDLPRVFDRFYRVSKDRSRKTGGSGLGLSIAQWLASLHGGEIIAESALGSGSTFRVILPLKQASRPDSSILQNGSAQCVEGGITT
jgi:heavy metal sensor kinase